MDEIQQAVLRGIATQQGTATPQGVAHHLNTSGDGSIYPPTTHYSWQGVARVAGELARKGLVKRHSLPKMTWYEITSAGREELDGHG
jgi:hypothetical protein